MKKSEKAEAKSKEFDAHLMKLSTEIMLKMRKLELVGRFAEKGAGISHGHLGKK